MNKQKTSNVRGANSRTQCGGGAANLFYRPFPLCPPCGGYGINRALRRCQKCGGDGFAAAPKTTARRPAKQPASEWTPPPPTASTPTPIAAPTELLTRHDKFLHRIIKSAESHREHLQCVFVSADGQTACASNGHIAAFLQISDCGLGRQSYGKAFAEDGAPADHADIVSKYLSISFRSDAPAYHHRVVAAPDITAAAIAATPRMQKNIAIRIGKERALVRRQYLQMAFALPGNHPAVLSFADGAHTIVIARESAAFLFMPCRDDDEVTQEITLPASFTSQPKPGIWLPPFVRRHAAATAKALRAAEKAERAAAKKRGQTEQNAEEMPKAA